MDIKEITEKRLVGIDNKLDTLSRLEEDLEHCKMQLNSISTVIRMLENSMDDLENRSTRSNLIVYGLPETETTETLEEAANKDVTQGKLQL